MSSHGNIERLRTFIEAEMKRRAMNKGEFSKLVGVSHTTIGRILNPSLSISPSAETLYKIARATGVTLSSLLSLLYPETDETVSAEDRILSQRIQALPPEIRKVIDSMIVGTLLKGGDEPEQK